MRDIGLIRTQERWIGGVAAGVARRLNIDPLLVRGVLVVLTVFGGLGLLLYGLAWALLPEESDGRIHIQEALAGNFSAGFVGAVVMTLLGSLRPGVWWQSFWWSGFAAFIGTAALLAVLVLGAIWVLPRLRGQRSGDDGEPRVPQDEPAPADHRTPPEPMQEGAPKAESHADPATTVLPSTPAPLQVPDLQLPALELPTVEPPKVSQTTEEDAPSSAPTSMGPPPTTPTPTPPTPTTPTPMAAASTTRVPTPPERPELYGRNTSPTITRITLALALIAAAVVLIWGRAFDPDFAPWLMATAAVIGVLGVGMIVAGARGRTAGWLGFWSFMTAVIAVPVMLSVAIAPQLRDAISLDPRHMGVNTWAPTSASELSDGSYHTAGRSIVDLSDLPDDATTGGPVEVALGAGQVIVEVPPNLDVDVHVTGTGAVHVDGAQGWYDVQDQEVLEPGDSTPLIYEELLFTNSPEGDDNLVVNVSLGGGNVQIREVEGN